MYATYMSKYMKYIFTESCIFGIYFAYIFFIVRYILQNIFDIYSTALEIYFGAKELCTSHIGIFRFHEGYWTNPLISIDKNRESLTSWTVAIISIIFLN